MMFEWAVLSYIRRKFDDVKHLSTESLENRSFGVSYDEESSKSKKEPEQKHVILDCRRQDEFEVSHIPDAKNVNFQIKYEDLKNVLLDEAKKLTNTEQKDINIVCYCSLGYRSSMLAQKIQNLAKDDPDLSGKNIKAWNLEGSIFKWANENRPMMDLNEKPTKFAHPFSYTFCMLLQKQYWKWTPDSKTNASEDL